MFNFRLSFNTTIKNIKSTDGKVDIFDKSASLSINITKNQNHENIQITIEGENYPNYREAATEMLRVEQAMLLSAIENDFGISNNNSNHIDYPKKKILEELERPFLTKGLMFSELTTRRAYPSDTHIHNAESSQEYEALSLSKIKEKAKNIYKEYNIAFELLPAIKLLNSIHFEYSSKVRLILAMTVVEMLADKNLTRSPEEKTLIDKLIQEVQLSPLDDNKKTSLSKAIEGCKYYSISNACKKLIKEKLGKKKANDFFELYDYRSRAVHAGSLDDPLRSDEQEADIFYTSSCSAYLLAKELISKILEDHKSNGDAQFLNTPAI